MQPSSFGASLKAARERVGWSREALAFHSGVSWSAIAQIETGRRNDVRLSSLVALAAALDVSVDYLIGAAPRPDLLEHRLFTYTSEDEFLTRRHPKPRGRCRTGSRCARRDDAGGHSSTSRHIGRPSRTDRVCGLGGLYRSPQGAQRYVAFLEEQTNAGVLWITVVAEAGWSGQSEEQIAAWTRYESLVNLAFASSPATVVCTYDERLHSPEAIAEASRPIPRSFTARSRSPVRHTSRRPISAQPVDRSLAGRVTSTATESS